jgi:ABC-2 type transport system permease protein
MHRALRFAVREYVAAVKTKGFIIGLVLAPIMMSGGAVAFLLLKDRVDTTDKMVVVIDRSGVLAGAILEAARERNASELYDASTGEKVRPAYLFEVMPPDEADPAAQRLALSERVRRGDLHAFVEIGPAVVHPGDNPDTRRIAYYGRSAAMDDLRRWVQWPINNTLRALRLEDAGIDEARVPDLFHWVEVEGMGLVSVDEKTGDVNEAARATPFESLLVPIIFMFLMFLMIMMSVPGMVQSVMEEKTQRIAEVLLGSIKPFEFMMGKVMGGIAVSLTSSLVYIIGGVVFVEAMGFQEYVPYSVLPWFFAYMLLAIVMFGALAAALGSVCNEPKDAQSLTFPAILPAIIPVFVYFPVAKEPLSAFATWMSLIPPFAPTLMILRIATPEPIPLWQPVAGLLGVLIFTVLSVWVGGRLFRTAILTQGAPPKFANILRWALRG